MHACCKPSVMRQQVTGGLIVFVKMHFLLWYHHTPPPPLPMCVCGALKDVPGRFEVQLLCRFLTPVHISRDALS